MFRCSSNTWPLFHEDFSFSVSGYSAVFYKEPIHTLSAVQDRTMITLISGLWWWSTSVCSKAALQERSALSLNLSPVKTNSMSEGVEKSWRRRRTLMITVHMCGHKMLHSQNSGIKNKIKGNGSYSFLVGNDVWYVLNSGSFQPPESLAKLLCYPFSCKKNANYNNKTIHFFKGIVWHFGEFGLFALLRDRWEDRYHSHVGRLNISPQPADS